MVFLQWFAVNANDPVAVEVMMIPDGYGDDNDGSQVIMMIMMKRMMMMNYCEKIIYLGNCPPFSFWNIIISATYKQKIALDTLSKSFLHNADFETVRN